MQAVLLIAVLIVGTQTQLVQAETATSPNYQVSETQFGGGSTLDSCSGQFCARTTIGDTTIGTSTDGTSNARFGAITDSEPMLEVIVDPGQSNLGVLTTERTATKTTIVRVRTHLSSGYTLQIMGAPPSVNGHTLATSSSVFESRPGVEQFGINMVANTLPLVGANPTQVPSDQTSFGTVSSGYNTPNRFKYSAEDVVARSQSESGRTDYTISMIVNISSSTPAGHYSGDFSAIVVPIY